MTTVPRGFISVRTNIVADPTSDRLEDIAGDFIRCSFGEALDSAEDCVVDLLHNHPAIPDLAIRNTLLVQDEHAEVREFRIRHLYDYAQEPTAVVKASPILHDLGDVMMRQLVDGVWTETFTATLSPRGWAQLICDNMARMDQPWWEVGTMDVDGAITISVQGETCLAVARRVIDGTLASVMADRNGELGWLLSFALVEPAGTPWIVAGENVVVLDREVHADGQVTIVSATGMTTAGDVAAQSIEEVPFVIDSQPSPGVVAISDHDLSHASLAIEDDQFVGVPAISYADKALVGMLPPPVELTLATALSETRRCDGAARVGDRLFFAVRRGTSGEVGQLHEVDIATGVTLNVYDLTIEAPDSIVYVPGVDRLYVASNFDDTIVVIDPNDGSETATISVPGCYWLHLNANGLLWTTADAGIVVIDPATDAVDTTISNATIGVTVTNSRLTEDGTSVYALSASGTVVQIVKCTIASKAYASKVNVSASVTATDLFSLLAWDSTNSRLWIASTTHLAVFSSALAHVSNPPGLSLQRSMLAKGGEIMVVATENRITVFDGSNLVGTLLTDGPDDDHETGCLFYEVGPDWYVHGTGTGSPASFRTYVRYWSRRSRAQTHPRTITAVDYATGQVTLDETDLLPWRLGDSVWIRNDDGTGFRDLWSPLAVALYGHIDGSAVLADRRSERNLVRTPTPTIFDGSDQPEGWTHFPFTLEQVRYRRHTPDGYAPATYPGLTATAAAPDAEGFQTVTVDGLPGNLVAQPGDVIRASPGGFIYALTVVERTVVAPVPGTAYTGLDTFARTGQVSLSSHVPTTPGSSGWTAWEYTGTASDFVVEDWDGMRNNVTTPTPRPLRINVNFTDDNIELVGDFERLSADMATSSGLAFLIPNTAIGSYTNREYYYVRIERASAGTASLELYHVDASGTTTKLTTGLGTFAMTTSGGGGPFQKRVRVTVEGLTCKAYLSDFGTGASELLWFTQILPVDYRLAALAPGADPHTRVGIQAPTGTNSGAIALFEFAFTDLANPPVPLGAATAIPCLSNAPGALAAAPATYYRPLPGSISDLDDVYVWPTNNGAFILNEQYVEIPVYIPPPLRSVQTARLAIGGVRFGGSSMDFNVTLTAIQTETPVPVILDEVMSLVGDLAAFQAGGVDVIDFQYDLTTPPYYGWYLLRIVPQEIGGAAAAITGTSYGGALIDLKVSVFWGTEAAPAFGRSNGGGWLWQDALNALLDRSSPFLHYRVQALEGAGDQRFLLGTRNHLREEARGISSDTARTVSVRRELLGDHHDPARDRPMPVIVLDNRSFDLAAALVRNRSV